MSMINAPVSSNDDETTPAQTTTEALEWHVPVLVRVDEHMMILHLLKGRVQRDVARPLILCKTGTGDAWCSIAACGFHDGVQSVTAGLIV